MISKREPYYVQMTSYVMKWYIASLYDIMIRNDNVSNEIYDAYVSKHMSISFPSQCFIQEISYTHTLAMMTSPCILNAHASLLQISKCF